MTFSDNLAASFSADPGNGYAIRLRDAARRVYARSNARSLDSKRRLLALEVTKAISEAEFGTFAPPVPFRDDRTTFDRLVLDFVGANLRMLGHAEHDGVINERFTLDYRFRLLPVDIPVWEPVSSLPEDETPDDTLTVDTTSLVIDADRRRQELLLGILNPIIRRRLRKAIQRRFHEAILKQAAESALNPVVTLTGAEVVDGKHVDLKIGILADAPG